jgi:hypothetical protein
VRVMINVLTLMLTFTARGDPPIVLAHPEADPVWQLCRFWKSEGKRPSVTAELKKRGDFTADEWEAIDEGRIYVGARELPMICSIGFYESLNNTVTAGGTKTLYVFGRGLYVYVENGLVTAWQN